MTPEEREMLTALASELLAAGNGDVLVDEIATSGMAEEVWSDPDTTARLFETQGALGATSALLDLITLRQVGTRLLLPLPGSAQPPGRVLGKQIAIDGVASAYLAGQPLVVALDSGDVVQLDATGTVVDGFDPALGLVRIQTTVTLDQCVPLEGVPDWDGLVARTARTLAWQLVGVASAARTLAVRHVQDRHQFGRPIGSFQTVQHRLADALIAETGAREVLTAAGEPTDGVVERLVVKAVAGRAALIAVAAAQQVCGAMGFTAEFGLHAYVRRAYLLDALLGGSEDAEADLAAYVLTTGLPPRQLVSL